MPHSKIELYNPADTLIYTLNDEAININVKEILTSDVGTFNFSLPTSLGGSYKYYDVAGNWKAKIYIANDTPAASDLIQVGRIRKISAPLSADEGYIRIFEGKNLGEKLERWFKYNKRWQGVEADDIAAEVASDLTLGSDLAVDTTAETITVRTESYFDLLKKISDYWFNAGVQVKKDFYVDTGDAGHPNGHLVWKTRPIRTAGVETLTIGDNILSYLVIRDLLSVKNYITVYGAPYSAYPADKDNWTENNATNWTALVGTITHNCATSHVGSFSIDSEGVANPVANEAWFYRTHDRITIRDINRLSFWHQTPTSVNTNGYVRLLAPDLTNYFQSPQIVLAPVATWFFESWALGPSNEYSATYNPNGQWTPSTALANWWDIKGIEFYYCHAAVTDVTDYTDGVYYSPVRFVYVVEDAASQNAYGRSDAEFTDNNLLSDAACETRVRTLLYQLKDPVVRVDIAVKGTSNLKIGDRLNFAIPAENITVAENYDVVAVQQNLSMAGWITTASMVNSVNIRQLPPASINEVNKRQIKNLKEVTSDLFERIVR